MENNTGTNKADKRWWHIEKYLNGTKALIIGKFQLNWYYKRLLIIKSFNEFVYNFFIKNFLDKYNE